MDKRFAEHSQLNLSEVNKAVLKQWDEADVFHKSMTEREGCPSFVFYEGPPSANGMPGIHHVMARTIKDTFCRFKTMKGFQVKRKAGCHNGNPYPTHGLGPIALAMDINRGDRMKSIVSVSSKRVEGDGEGSLSGTMNSSIITTEKGKTILVQHCISLPRPYSRSFLLSGTEGFAQKYPTPQLAFAPDSEDVISGDACKRMIEKYRHPIVAKYKERGEELCGRRWIDYAMDCRLIHCLRNGLPLDMNVYDAALWSCLVELTDISASKGGAPVEIPDFTRGKWDKEIVHIFH